MRKAAHSDLKSSRFLNILMRVVALNAKFLALLMVFVIFWATVDVVFYMYQQLIAPVESSFNIERLINLLGVFLGVLIAIEVYANIIFYLTEDSINVPLVLATALTAVARKVIVLDYASLPPLAIFALAAMTLALGSAFWMSTLSRTCSSSE